MTLHTRAGRCATHYAAKTLYESGYTTERITGSGRRFDLIAWKKNTLLFLVIRTARVPEIARFSDEILKLSLMVHRHEIPGELQIWLYHPAGISRYQILSGGAIQITGRQV